MTEPPRVLILVVDEIKTRGERRKEALALEGWRPAVVSRASDARPTLEDYRVHVLVLGGSTAPELDLLRDLRTGGIPYADRNTKTIAVGIDNDAAAVVALDAGADLILPSTASESVIAAGVRTVDRRLRVATRQVSQLGDIAVDRELREVIVAGQSFSTTRREFDLLAAVTGDQRRVWTRNEIAMAMWGSLHMADNSRAIDTHISRLNVRAREMGIGPVLDNVRGSGYVVSTARSDQNLAIGL